METGKAHMDCMCESEKIILDFNSSVNNLFEIYPEFNDLDLVRFKSADGLSIAQSLEGIKAQANTSLSCP